MFGSNKYGQLGVGDYKERSGVTLVSGVLGGQKVTKVSCGEGFTVISTAGIVKKHMITDAYIVMRTACYT